jgi:hypothetical protein
MKNILIFLIYPNRFYKKIMEGELKLFILILFVVNVFLSILWDIKIGIPFGGYEIYYFDNKLLDSSVSVALNTLALMIISGSLYVFTKKCKLENRFQKPEVLSYCFQFSNNRCFSSNNFSN